MVDRPQHLRVSKDESEIRRLSYLDAIAPISTPNQFWAVIIYVGPEADQPCDKMAISILGAYPTVSDARDYVDRIRRDGFDMFTMYIVEMNKLLAFPPPKDVEDRHYANSLLEQIMDRQKERMFKSEARINTRLHELHEMEAKIQLCRRDNKTEEADKLQGELSTLRRQLAAEAEAKENPPRVQVTEPCKTHEDTQKDPETHINRVRCVVGTPQTERPANVQNVCSIKPIEN